MTDRSERGQRLDPAGAAAVPPPSMSLPAPPPPSRGWHRFENDRWIGVTGPGPALTTEEYERFRDAFLKEAATGRMTILSPDPMEVMIRESAAVYGKAFVYRDPSTGEEHVLDPQWVTIVKPAAPFRIDVPTVPAHVTCLKDVNGRLWLFEHGGWNREDYAFWCTGAATLAEFAPLVEHPDPRKATT